MTIIIIARSKGMAQRQQTSQKGKTETETYQGSGRQVARATHCADKTLLDASTIHTGPSTTSSRPKALANHAVRCSFRPKCKMHMIKRNLIVGLSVAALAVLNSSCTATSGAAGRPAAQRQALNLRPTALARLYREALAANGRKSQSRGVRVF